jgi:hypothetical protein
MTEAEANAEAVCQQGAWAEETCYVNILRRSGEEIVSAFEMDTRICKECK